jgi:DNA-binding response OmpR family regulator
MKKRLLIVEDESEFAMLFVWRAKANGYDCKVDLTGETCLEKAKSYTPDLIVLDMNLPIISGLGLIKELKINPQTSNIPILILSAVGQKEVIDEAITRGADSYFLKTGSMVDLFSIIDQHIKESPLSLS